MTWSIDVERSKQIRRGAAVIGARVVLMDSERGDRRVLDYTRVPGMTAAQFRTMLLGPAGNPQAPAGELGTILDGLNAAGDTEDPL